MFSIVPIPPNSPTVVLWAESVGVLRESTSSICQLVGLTPKRWARARENSSMVGKPCEIPKVRSVISSTGFFGHDGCRRSLPLDRGVVVLLVLEYLVPVEK